jgi:hypothetical protein
VARRRQDAEKIFAEAAAEKMTGSGYAWIVTEQATIKFSFLQGKIFGDFTYFFATIKFSFSKGKIFWDLIFMYFLATNKVSFFKGTVA